MKSNRIESKRFEGKRKLRRIEKHRLIFSAVETFMRIHYRRRRRRRYHYHHHHQFIGYYKQIVWHLFLSLSWMSKKPWRILKWAIDILRGKNGWKKIQYAMQCIGLRTRTRLEFLFVYIQTKRNYLFIFGSACQTMAGGQQQ